MTKRWEAEVEVAEIQMSSSSLGVTGTAEVQPEHVRCFGDEA